MNMTRGAVTVGQLHQQHAAAAADDGVANKVAQMASAPPPRTSGWGSEWGWREKFSPWVAPPTIWWSSNKFQARKKKKKTTSVKSRCDVKAAETSPLLAEIGIKQHQMVDCIRFFRGLDKTCCPPPPLSPPTHTPNPRPALICSKVEAQVTLGAAVMMQEVVCLIKSGH